MVPLARECFSKVFHRSIKVLKEPGPGPEMASPEEVNEVLARAHRILAKQRLLEMPTISNRIH